MTFTLAAVLFSQSVLAGQREDYLECELSNGDKFILINKYDYSPLARFTRHGANRTNQIGFIGHFKTNNGIASVESMGNFGKFDVSVDLERKKTCSSFFLIGNKSQSSAYIFNTSNNEAVREDVPFPDHRIIDALDMDAEKQGLFTPRHPTPYHIKNGNNIRIEYSLTKIASLVKSNIVDAIITVESTDNGQTWSAPIITKDAKLFVIGKSILDQPAVAKPGKWKKGPG